MKRTALLLLALLALALLATGAAADGDTDADSGPGVAWFRSIPSARLVAEHLGRPILLAVHPRLAGLHTAWPTDPGAWADVYGDPRVIEKSRAFACVLHLVGAPPTPGDPAQDGRPAVKASVSQPVHLVVDASAKIVLARLDAWPHEPGEPSIVALVAFLDAAFDRADAVSAATPLIGPEAVPPQGQPAPGGDPLSPASVPIEGPGFRTRLRWQLPVPDVESAEAGMAIPAAVRFYWDGQGPFDLGHVEIRAGADVDIPLDVRFADHEALEPLLSRGRHRVDVYIEPTPDGFRFSNGPLHVGLVWIELGDGDGPGGDNEQPEPQPTEAPPPEPKADPPVPEEGAGPDPEPPKEEQTHVVEPFVRDGDMIEKDDAIVAVEDDDAGVKPPPPIQAEAAPREFEKMLEHSVAWERIPPQEREFLRRYFAALRKAMERADAAGGGK